MSTWAAMGAGGRAVILVLGAVAAGGVGYLVWDGTRGVPAAEQGAEAPEAARTAAAAPEAAAPAADAPAAEAAVAEPQPVSVLPPVMPVIGTWAVTADGSCTVAGTAVAGALVKVLVDGAPVAETVATAGGEFALVTTLAPNPNPSVMSLVMVLPDGTEVPGAATVALGPIAGPDVVAEDAPAAVMVTDEGAVVLQEAPAEEPVVAETPEAVTVAETPVAEELPVAEVTIETITYTPGGAVQLGGSGQPGAFVRLYLDNALIQEVLVPDGGKWLTTLKDTAPGIYTLRADQVDAAGKVTARFETPFKRETPEALAAAAAGGTAAEDPATEVAAAEPAAEEPVATEPAATEVAAAEPVATEPAATEVAAAEPVATEPAATEVAAAEPVATEPAATEVAAAEPAATEATAAEPAATEPAATEVAAAEPAATEPAATEPAATEVAAAEPEATEPAATEVAAAEPAPTELAATEVAAAEPVATEPAVAEPVAASEPAATEPLAEEPVVEEAAVQDPAPPPAPVTITVQPGYTLWGIAEGQMGEGILYVQVWEANKDQIKDPDLIYPGQVFTLPAETAQP